MALSIKNKEVEALARELARISRKTLTIAVRDSHRREVERAKVLAAASLAPADIGVDTKRNRVAVPFVARNLVEIWQLPRQ